MNTDVDVLTEHLLQRERQRQRERERERRMGGTHEVERRHRQTYGQTGIETEGEVHEHRHRLSDCTSITKREREEGRRELDRQREGRYA